MNKLLLIVPLALISLSLAKAPHHQEWDDVLIEKVVIRGGDEAQFTTIYIDEMIPGYSGYIDISQNLSYYDQILSTILTAKSTGSKVSIHVNVNHTYDNSTRYYQVNSINGGQILIGIK